MNSCTDSEANETSGNQSAIKAQICCQGEAGWGMGCKIEGLEIGG